jgi:hypothetical protein
MAMQSAADKINPKILTIGFLSEIKSLQLLANKNNLNENKLLLEHYIRNEVKKILSTI